MGVLQLRETFPKTWRLIPQLVQADRDIIEAFGLTSLLEMPEVRLNRALLTTLAERWHSDTNTFHLPTREITVTPEDVYRILRIPVMGEIASFNVQKAGGTDALRRIFGDDEIVGYYISWREMIDSYAPLPSVLAGFIGGVLCPDHRSKGFAVRWGHVLERMVMQGTQYAWGSCMLVHLYDELHHIVYGRGQSFAIGCSLLQIWAWEHFAIM